MAAISSISNGEAMSSVRTKLNSVITEINLLDPTDWIDYSATSTVVGWTTPMTTKIIRYRVIGKQLFCIYNFNGTSNSTSVTFTLPNNLANSNLRSFGFSIDNGTTIGSNLVSQNSGSNLINVYKDNFAVNAWTASGSKLAYGQFFIEIA